MFKFHQMKNWCKLVLLKAKYLKNYTRFFQISFFSLNFRPFMTNLIQIFVDPEQKINFDLYHPPAHCVPVPPTIVMENMGECNTWLFRINPPWFGLSNLVKMRVAVAQQNSCRKAHTSCLGDFQGSVTLI